MKFGKRKAEKDSDESANDVENNNYCRKDSGANLIVTGLEACRPDTFLNPRLVNEIQHVSRTQSFQLDKPYFG